MEYETKTALVIGLGSVALIFFVMLLVIITSKSKRNILEKENKLQAMEREKQIEVFRAAAQAEEKQKFKIASNLHDQIIPVLLLKARNIANHISELEKKGFEVEKLKKEVEDLSTLSNDIRGIAHDLIPKLFTSFGLIKSLEVFIKEINDSSESAAEFHTTTTFSGELPFSNDNQLIIYRICLEILNNLFKYANYDYLTVSLEDMKKNFILVFAHNGMGVTNEEIAGFMKSGTGIGLKSLQSKALFLNAKIDYSKDTGVSFVKLIVPFKND